LWEAIVRTAYECAEPGVIYIDRVRMQDNLGYAERIGATNPCGEIPLPPYGACDLGSLNLTRFVSGAFTPEARLDTAALTATARIAVRMLDNVYDVSGFPLPRQADVARASRRIGLGITGLADALIMLGLRYDGLAARQLATDTMRQVTEAAYAASAENAREKGTFPLYDRDRYMAAPFVQALPATPPQWVAELAKELAVNQNTVLHVYERLTAEGLLERRQGDGTYVADSLPPGLLRAQRGLLEQEVLRLARRATSLGVPANEVRKLLDAAFEKANRQTASAAKGGTGNE
jgi:ribonucleotide reductase alpha subunit